VRDPGGTEASVAADVIVLMRASAGRAARSRRAGIGTVLENAGAMASSPQRPASVVSLTSGPRSLSLPLSEVPVNGLEVRPDGEGGGGACPERRILR
jgi:hypothetical protein